MSSEILADENRKICKGKGQTVEPEKVFEVGGNSERGGNASLPQGMDAPACHWISLKFLYDRRVCTHSIDPSLADCEFPGSELALVPDVVVPEAEHGHGVRNCA